MKTRCYFNNVQVSEKPFEVDEDAPYIDLDVDFAYDICEELLDAGIIDSFCIPAFTDHKVKFNKNSKK